MTLEKWLAIAQNNGVIDPVLKGRMETPYVFSDRAPETGGEPPMRLPDACSEAGAGEIEKGAGHSAEGQSMRGTWLVSNPKPSCMLFCFLYFTSLFLLV